MATYRKLCVDAVSPETDGPTLARMLGLPWRADDDGEGGLMGPVGRYLVWVNAVPDTEAKSERVRLDIRSRRWCGVEVSADDPQALATWWARALDGTSQTDASGIWEVAGVPGMPVPLRFVPATEPKTAPNRVHWDVTGDPDAMIEAGATMLQAAEGELGWHVLADPEGNEFCVFAADGVDGY
jgi:glyoxalase superfamily protein